MSLPNNWSAIKKKWRLKNPPDKDGNYICWVCKQPVHSSAVSLDHIAPVSQYPEYAKDLSNLRPSHIFCNEQRTAPKHSKVTQIIARVIKRRKRR